MTQLARYLGGSHSYGLDTAASDTDYRGVYLTGNPSALFGFSSDDSFVLDTDGVDQVYYELRHFLRLLKKTNTQAAEMLYNTRWITKDPLFDDLTNNKEKLIDAGRLYISLAAYAESEYQAAIGQRRKKLGEKRVRELEQYGYSPKNFVQLLRLLYCGETFFLTGHYPLDLFTHNQPLAKELLSIKIEPQKHSVVELEEKYQKAKGNLQLAFRESPVLENYKFDEEFAVDFCKKAYGRQFFL